jgi:predicted MFS family arabinose efflux permease
LQSWRLRCAVELTRRAAQHGVMTLPRRLTLLIGLTQTLGYATTYYVPATMTGAAAADLGVSRTALLGGFSLALLVYGLASPMIGRRIERRGGRMLLTLGAPVTAVGLLALAASQGLVLWYLGWLVIGVGMALALYDAAFGCIGRLLGHEARPVIVGVTLMAGLASTIGWPTGSYLVTEIGWRWALALYAALQVAVIVPATLLAVPRDEATQRAGPGRDAEPPLQPMRWDRRFAWLATHFTMLSAVNAVVSVHVLVLLQGFGFSSGTAVAAASLVGPAQVCARMIDWFFGRAVSPMLPALIGAVAMPASVVALVLGLPAPVFTVVYGVSSGIFTISRGTLPMHVFGPEGYAERIGIMAQPLMFASAVAPTLVAPLMAMWPRTASSGLLLAMGGISLAGLLVLRAMLPRQAR